MRAVGYLIAACLACATVLGIDREAILVPVVQVHGSSGEGSGTIIQNGEGVTRVLTNWHVVQGDIRKADDEEIFRDLTVSVFTWYDRQIIDSRRIAAAIIKYDRARDLALLELRAGDRPWPGDVQGVAKLATREQMRGLRVFADVWVVGSGLGYPAMPTSGILTATSYMIEGQRFLVGSAPIIFGNSGGGLFTKIDGEWILIGVPARMAVYRGQAITHIAFHVPADTVHDFLEK